MEQDGHTHCLQSSFSIFCHTGQSQPVCQFYAVPEIRLEFFTPLDRVNYLHYKTIPHTYLYGDGGTVVVVVAGGTTPPLTPSTRDFFAYFYNLVTFYTPPIPLCKIEKKYKRHLWPLDWGTRVWSKCTFQSWVGLETKYVACTPLASSKCWRNELDTYLPARFFCFQISFA